MPSEFKIRHTVQFVETDMAGIVHFSNFFRWMEACETAFYRSLKLPLISFNPGKVVGWPRVNVSCEYRAPLTYGDVVEVRLLVKELRTRAVVYAFEFRKIVRGRPQAKVTARGEITAVCVTNDPESGKMISAPIPLAVRTKLKVAPATALAK